MRAEWLLAVVLWPLGWCVLIDELFGSDPMVVVEVGVAAIFILADRLFDLETMADADAIRHGFSPRALAAALMKGDFSGRPAACSYTANRRVQRLLDGADGLETPQRIGFPSNGFRRNCCSSSAWRAGSFDRHSDRSDPSSVRNRLSRRAHRRLARERLASD